MLGRDDVFDVTYGPKMIRSPQARISSWALPRQEQAPCATPQHTASAEGRADASSPDRSLPIGALCAAFSANVVTDYARFIPARVMTQYFGLEPQDEPQLIADCQLMFRFLFIPNNPPRWMGKPRGGGSRPAAVDSQFVPGTIIRSPTVMTYSLANSHASGWRRLSDLDLRTT